MLLYPPTIEGQLPPAVLIKNDSENRIEFTIPYQINRGTNPKLIKGYSIKIKNLISNELIKTYDVIQEYCDNDFKFSITGEDLNLFNLGDYFKIQMAFGANVEDKKLTDIGYYSTVGVSKLIAQPLLQLAPEGDKWTGTYFNSQFDELLYSSQFILKDENEQIIEIGEVEIINYLNQGNTTNDELFENYFDQYIKPGLEQQSAQAETNLKEYKDWYEAASFEDLSEPLMVLNNTPHQETKVELNTYQIAQDSVISGFQTHITTTKKKLAEHDYTNPLESAKNLKADLVSNVTSLSQSKLTKEDIDTVNNNIKTFNNLFNSFVDLFSQHLALLQAECNYWNNMEISQNYEPYKNSIRNTGKTVTYRFNSSQKVGYNYIAEWKIETSSGYKTSISRPGIMNNELLEPDYRLIPRLRFNENSACAELAVQAGFNQGDLSVPKDYGHWIVLKATSKDNFSSWTQLYDIPNFYSWYLSNNNEFENIMIKDYNIEHGVGYQYALQQVNKYDIYSVKVTTPIITAKFESIFICDENRQLKIAFNPKISSMKNNVLESKQDTIGGKYPHIFRNGNVLYKEFSLSGLLSYLEDPDNEFKIDFGEYKELNTTNLTDENIAKERIFKLEVLEWLNNGKIKLLKTATEGNYLVRLINVSMSPNDTLGRMLHSFSATAIEIENQEFNVNLEVAKQSEEIIHVETFTSTPSDEWLKDKRIKEIWIYGKAQGDSIKISTVDAPNNLINIAISPLGLRMQTYEGKEIASVRFVDQMVDIYYSFNPIFEEQNFSKIKKCETQESIQHHTVDDEVKEIEGQNFYKVLTAVCVDPPLPTANEEWERLYTLSKTGYDTTKNSPYILTLLDASGITEEIYIADQLTLQDVWLKKVSWGDKLEITCCYVAPNIDVEG